MDRQKAPLAAVALGWVAFIWGWRSSILTLPVDDAYYYMQIARNVARGAGATFGGQGVTGGFHPLWLGALVPLAHALGSQPDTYVRAVLTLNVVLVVAGGLTLGRVGQHVPWLIALALVPFHTAKILLNGQESSLAWLLISLCVARLFARDRGNELVDGVLAGALCLARLSALPLALTFLLVPMVLERPLSKHTLTRGARSLAVMSCIGGVWAVWLVVRTGHLVTVSASIKMGSSGAVTLASLLGLACAAAALLLARRWPGAAWLAPLSAQVAAELSVSVVRGTLVPEIWTLVPHLMLAICLLGGALRGRMQSRAVALATVGAIALGIFSWRLRLDPQSWSAYASARRAGEWVSANSPRDAVVAGWDCGIAALFADRSFYPLDGLVGTWRYKTEVLDAGKVEAFVHERRVDYIVQYVPVDVLAVDPSVSFGGVRLAQMDVAWSECGVFRSSLTPRAPWGYAYFVLRREPGIAPLGGMRAVPCGRH